MVRQTYVLHRKYDLNEIIFLKIVKQEQKENTVYLTRETS